MNCCHGESTPHSSHHAQGHHACACGCGGSSGAVFWSKPKKIEVLEKDLEQIQERRKELESLIRELKEE